jgi:hypothetical protein
MSSIPSWVEEKYPKKIACRKDPSVKHRDALMSADPEGPRTAKQRENSRPQIYRRDVALTPSRCLSVRPPRACKPVKEKQISVGVLQFMPSNWHMGAPV